MHSPIFQKYVICQLLNAFINDIWTTLSTFETGEFPAQMAKPSLHYLSVKS